MQLSDENITKFQALYKKRFGTEISKEGAHAQGIKLLRLMSLVYRPMTQSQLDAVRARRREFT